MHRRDIRVRYIGWLIAATALCVSAAANDSAVVVPDSLAGASSVSIDRTPSDSISKDPIIPSDTVAAVLTKTTIPGNAVTDTAKVDNGRIKVVDRKLRYRSQIGAALGMMAFIVIIMTTTQSMNPD